MAFTHIQRASVNQTSAVLTFNFALASNPTQGNLVCVAVCIPSAIGLPVTCADSNGNTYTNTPHSPSVLLSGGAAVFLFYLLKAPANATKTLTISWSTNTSSAQAWADEFSYSGTCLFDKDSVNTTSQGPGTTINTPTITPLTSGELLYACSATAGNITAPAAGGTLGVWTGSGGAIQNGNMAEYDLSASSNTAVQYTQGSASWSGAVMAFWSHLPGHIQLEGGTGNVELENASGDIALEY